MQRAMCFGVLISVLSGCSTQQQVRPSAGAPIRFLSGQSAVTLDDGVTLRLLAPPPAEASALTTSALPIVPWPFALVVIENRSSQTLRFSDDAVWLEDETGRRAPALLDGAKVMARMIQMGASMGLRFRDGFRLPSVLLAETEIPPGRAFVGWISFDTGAYTLPELSAWLAGGKRYRVQVHARGAAQTASLPLERRVFGTPENWARRDSDAGYSYANMFLSRNRRRLTPTVSDVVKINDLPVVTQN